MAESGLCDLDVVCLPFVPEEFLGGDWIIWRGPANGNGLEGEEDRMGITGVCVVNLDEVQFMTFLYAGEPVVKGEDKRARILETRRTVYGLNLFMGLWRDYWLCRDATEASKLERLYRSRGIRRIDFFADVLRCFDTCRYIISLERVAEGEWKYTQHWLGADYGAESLAPVSA